MTTPRHRIAAALVALAIGLAVGGGACHPAPLPPISDDDCLIPAPLPPECR